MGIAERKEREREEMRQLILDAATKLFIETGFDKTSIRTIADAIEYSPATIYLYFKDKNELFHAIHTLGFEKFFGYLSQVMVIQDPMERLDKLGQQYLKFAVENPGFYDLMFIMRAPMCADETEDRWSQGDKSHSVLTQTVAECMEKGHFEGRDPQIMSFMIWSMVHGLSAMLVRDRIKHMYATGEERVELLFEAKKTFTAMLRKF